jgi:serine/threonine-protein kinase HipA
MMTSDTNEAHQAFVWIWLPGTTEPVVAGKLTFGNEASQAMLISGENRMSRITTCLKAAHHFLLSEKMALKL